ncbi:hypothetical protein FVE85_8657 [Porphyridium purpureum]|uniref:Uncharacterized protein n=1 Tax=Porphyridium purpureum TaxID=35688 RepID=A0A5J4YQZ6_PORPP|nr:hypothetical protein FVE85_8657 [Porphyridium purpureum]|eukprot:POR8698..scf296_7
MVFERVEFFQGRGSDVGSLLLELDGRRGLIEGSVSLGSVKLPDDAARLAIMCSGLICLRIFESGKVENLELVGLLKVVVLNVTSALLGSHSEAIKVKLIEEIGTKREFQIDLKAMMVAIEITERCVLLVKESDPDAQELQVRTSIKSCIDSLVKQFSSLATRFFTNFCTGKEEMNEFLTIMMEMAFEAGSKILQGAQYTSLRENYEKLSRETQQLQETVASLQNENAQLKAGLVNPFK